MAKRFNIIRNIKEEIKKGNVYVAPNGNFVSADLLNNEILAQFKRDLLANPEKTAAISYDQYKEKALSGYTTALEVMNGICESFGIINDDAGPAPETSEAVPNGSESVNSEAPDKPKHGKAKGGDAK